MKLCFVLTCVWLSVGLCYGGGSELVPSTVHDKHKHVSPLGVYVEDTHIF